MSTVRYRMLVGGGFGGRRICPCSTMRRCWPYGPCAGGVTGRNHPHSPQATARRGLHHGLHENGIIQGVKASVVSDTGAFASGRAGVGAGLHRHFPMKF
ncbi:MAG: hypothetical protein ACLTGT_05155 [Oscillospiraceae bacterium]